MNALKSFIYEEDGMGTIEIAIIIAALVALAIVFKRQLGELFSNVAKTMWSNTKKNAIEEEFSTVMY